MLSMLSPYVWDQVCKYSYMIQANYAQNRNVDSYKYGAIQNITVIYHSASRNIQNLEFMSITQEQNLVFMSRLLSCACAAVQFD